MTTRPVELDDLLAIQQPTSCRISPDGRWTAYTVQTMSLEKRRYFSEIHVTDMSGPSCRQFTFGEVADSGVTWNPNSREFLFTRALDGETSIRFLPIDGGESREIVRLKGIVADIVWATDGNRFAVLHAPADPPAKDADGKDIGVVVRHFKRPLYRMNGLGYYPKERLNLWVYDLTGEGRRLTHLDADLQSPVWSADGKHIYAIGPATDRPDIDVDHQAVFAISVADGTMERLPMPIGPWASLRLSHDGKHLTLVGNDKPGEGGWGWADTHPWVFDLETGEARNLTPDLDRPADNLSVGDLLAGLGTRGALWGPEDAEVTFQVSDTGSTHLYRLDVATGAYRKLLAGGRVVSDFDVADDGTTVALVMDAANPGDLYLVREDGHERFTGMNDRLREDVQFRQPEEVWFEGTNGDPVQGWVLKPEGTDLPAPAVLEIHGGPHVQYSNGFMFEFQYLAARGFLVMYCNPHGSQGYGKAFSQALENDWGGPDYPDQMAFVDTCIARGWADPERLGVTGGSYGGYMTIYCIGSTDRFKAACAQRCVAHTPGLYASDFSFHLRAEMQNRNFWEDIDSYLRQSPILKAGNFKTPTLVIHSEKDFRTTQDHGDMLYSALQAQGVESEYLLFPEENHDLSRSGRPDRRLIRLEHIADWFKRYLL